MSQNMRVSTKSGALILTIEVGINKASLPLFIYHCYCDSYFVERNREKKGKLGFSSLETLVPGLVSLVFFLVVFIIFLWKLFYLKIL